MDIRTQILIAAEQTFDRHGFTATGMDQLTAAAGVSTRTLYKHVGGKTALICAVLAERDRRYAPYLAVDSVDALFAGLQAWVEKEGARGCLFLRADSETGGDTPEIAAVVAAHKARVLRKIRALVAAQTGGRGGLALAEQVLVLFEGAAAAARYRGGKAVDAARAAAAALLAHACA